MGWWGRRRRGRAGHRAEEGHAGFHGGFHHGRRGAALDRSEQQEYLVLSDELAGIGLGGGRLVAVVQCAQHELSPMHPAAGIDLA